MIYFKWKNKFKTFLPFTLPLAYNLLHIPHNALLLISLAFFSPLCTLIKNMLHSFFYFINKYILIMFSSSAPRSQTLGPNAFCTAPAFGPRAHLFCFAVLCFFPPPLSKPLPLLFRFFWICLLQMPHPPQRPSWLPPLSFLPSSRGGHSQMPSGPLNFVR